MFEKIMKLSAINALSIVLSVFNTILVSYLFGTSREIEVWFGCLIIVQVIMKFSQSGELSEILLPIYKSYKSKNKEREAYKVTSAIINWFLIFLIFIIFVTFLFGSLIIKATLPGFNNSDQLLGYDLLIFISPVMILIFLSGQVQTLLNAKNIIGQPEKITLITRILNILTIFFGYDYFGVWVMPIALYCSTFFKNTLFIFYYLKSGGMYFFTLSTENESILKHLKKLYPTIPYLISTQIWTIAFNSGLSYLPQGSYAVFKYALTFISKLNYVMIRPISIIFFTNFANIYYSGDGKFKDLIKMVTENFMFMFSNILIFIYLTLEYFLILLLESKKFPTENIILLSKTVKILIFLPLFNCIYVLSRKILVTINRFEKTYLNLSIAQVITSITSLFILNKVIYGPESLIYLNVILLLTFTLVLLKKEEPSLLFFFEKRYFIKTMMSSILIILLGKFLIIFFDIGIYSIENKNILISLVIIIIYCLIMISLNVYILKLKPKNSCADSE